jgi:hypothetical protein
VRPLAPHCAAVLSAHRFSLLAVLMAGAASAQTLTATTDATFTLTSTQPAQTGGEGSGTVTVGCSPCANPAHTQYYSFGGVEFFYLNAPTEPYTQRVSGNGADRNVNAWPYTISLLPSGARLYPRIVDGACACANGAETSNKSTVDLMSLAFTVPPYLQKPIVFGSKNNGDVLVGTEVKYAGGTCAAKPKGAEQVRVKLSGAGVDITRDFAEGEYVLGAGDITFTATMPGTVNVTCSLEPYGALSNVQTISVIAGSGGTGGGSATGAGGGSGGGDPPPGGCASVPGVFALLAVVMLRRGRC